MPDIIRIAPGTRTHMQAKYNAIHGKFDVTRMVQGFVNPPAFPAAWAYWKFEEASGTRVDSSGNGHDLPLYYPAKDPDNADGKLNNCIHFLPYSMNEYELRISDIINVGDPQQWTVSF